MCVSTAYWVAHASTWHTRQRSEETVFAANTGPRDEQTQHERLSQTEVFPYSDTYSLLAYMYEENAMETSHAVSVGQSPPYCESCDE